MAEWHDEAWTKSIHEEQVQQNAAALAWMSQSVRREASDCEQGRKRSSWFYTTYRSLGCNKPAQAAGYNDNGSSQDSLSCRTATAACEQAASFILIFRELLDDGHAEVLLLGQSLERSLVICWSTNKTIHWCLYMPRPIRRRHMISLMSHSVIFHVLMAAEHCCRLGRDHRIAYGCLISGSEYASLCLHGQLPGDETIEAFLLMAVGICRRGAPGLEETGPDDADNKPTS
eukprot:284814882_6